jgi:WD40 repeat protein
MDETVKLWDLRTFQEVLTLREHRGLVGSVDFSPDGTRLLSASMDGTVRIWDARPLGSETGQAYRTLPGHQGGVRSVAFSPDGRWLASAADDDTVRVWDPRLGRAPDANPLIRTFDNCPGFHKVVFSHHGQWLAAGGARGSDVVKIWKTTTWELLSEQPEGGPPLAFSANDRYLAFRNSDKHLNFPIAIRDTTTGEEIASLRGHRWAIFDLAFSPREDAPLLTSASADGTVRIWDVKTGKEIVAPLQHSHDVRCVAFSPDARLLASGGSDRVLHVWDTQSWQRLQELPDSTGRVQSVVFHPKDSRVLAWGSSDGTVKVWKRTINEVRTLRGHTSWVESVAFSPDGKQIASASLDGTIRLWPVPPLPKAPDQAAGVSSD